MKKWTKSVLVTVLSAVFLLGCTGTAWADNPTRDANSGFTVPPTSGTATADSTVNSTIATDGMFYLIKDYDSENATKTDASGNSTQGAPKSSSPAETFTYTITPYKVWNAGKTSSTGTTPIDKSTMPMLYKTASRSESEISGTGTGRSLVVTQYVANDAALNESAEDNAHDANKTAIYLPKYDTVGDYWYQVVESLGENNSNPTTGVFYGTNSFNDSSNTTTDTAAQNGSHNRIYYIHVQVTENGSTSGTPTLVSNVTLHKTQPTGVNNTAYNSNQSSLYDANDKVNAIENRYYAGQLQVIKRVTGNAADRNEFFKVRVTFTKPAGTVVNSDIAIDQAYTLSSGTYDNSTTLTIPGQYDGTFASTEYITKWNQAANSTTEATAVAVFYVKDGTTVTFSNIPYGINYTVEEYSTGDLGYTNSFAITSGSGQLTGNFNGNTPVTDKVNSGSLFYDDDTTTTIPPTNVGAEGSITGAAADVVTITNEKNVTIDIGVITENAPFIALIAVSGAVLFLLVSRKKKLSEV